ncbi:hypothetical protein [Hymenobacter norwichensis]|uniref:hypothetical protein n=1 Tax=Hymenobacter norwichensis TaxID=223903 RepID=UPI0003B43799|nr:hypothetical protein [Hymenobacter norwichensis]
MRIQALAHVDNHALPCTGEVTIRYLNEQQAYVQWELCHGNTVLAAKSAPYFWQGNLEKLLDQVLEKITKHRINRVHIFTEVTYSHE